MESESSSAEDPRDAQLNAAVERVKQYFSQILPHGYDFAHFGLDVILKDPDITHVAELACLGLNLQLKIGTTGQLYFDSNPLKNTFNHQSKPPVYLMFPEEKAVDVFMRAGFETLAVSLLGALSDLVFYKAFTADVKYLFKTATLLAEQLQSVLPAEVLVKFFSVSSSFQTQAVSLSTELHDFSTAVDNSKVRMFGKFLKDTGVFYGEMLATEATRQEARCWAEILNQTDIDPHSLCWKNILPPTLDRSLAVIHLLKQYDILEGVWVDNPMIGLFMICVLREMAASQKEARPKAFYDCMVKCLNRNFPSQIPLFCKTSVQGMAGLPQKLKAKLQGLPEWHAHSAGASHPAPTTTSTINMKPKSSSSTTTTTTTTTTSSSAHPSPTVSSTGHANQLSTKVAGSTANPSGTVPSTWKSASPGSKKSPSGTTTTSTTPSTTTMTTSTSSTSSSKQPPPKGGSS